MPHRLRRDGLLFYLRNQYANNEVQSNCNY